MKWTENNRTKKLKKNILYNKCAKTKWLNKSRNKIEEKDRNMIELNIKEYK